MARDKDRNQKSVRYDDGRNKDLRLHFTFDPEDSTSPEFFRWILKCYESKARGSPECDGLKRLKRPELRGVLEGILPLKALPAHFDDMPREVRMAELSRLASDQAKDLTTRLAEQAKNSTSMCKGNQAIVAPDEQQATVAPEKQATDNQTTVPLDRGCGSENLLDNPEGRPPTIPVQERINMVFSELQIRALNHFYIWLELEGLKANLTDCFNALLQMEKMEFHSGSSPVPSPDGTQAEGRGKDVVGATKEGDTDGPRDLDTSLESVPRLTGRKRANEKDTQSPLNSEDEDTERQQPMKKPIVNYPMPSSPLGNQLEGSNIHGDGENVRSLDFSQSLIEFAELSWKDEGQQHDHGSPAHELKSDASYPQTNEICDGTNETPMEDGNTDVSASLEVVPPSTGRIRADIDIYEQLSPLHEFAPYERYNGEKDFEDPNHAFDVRGQVNALNPEGGVNGGFYSNFVA